MIMTLDLELVNSEDRKSFCYYIINELKDMFYKAYNPNKAKALENYINNSNIIRQRITKKSYFSVYDLYRLALESLEIKQLDENKFQIKVSNNKVIPNSYTNLYSIISLLEFGSLSVKKYGLLGECMQALTDNLTGYFIKYIGSQK